MSDDTAQAAPAETKPYQEPVTVALRKPITFGKRTVTELTIRPVKAKFMRGLVGSPMEQTLLMASKLTGEVSQVIDELEGEDLREVMDHVNGFLYVTLGTGK